MFPTGPELEIRPGATALLGRHPNQFTDTINIDRRKWILSKESVCLGRHAGIYPHRPEENPNAICVRSLVPNEKNSASAAISSAVIAPRGTSSIVPDKILDLYTLGPHRFGGDPVDNVLLIPKLLHVPDQRNHDLWARLASPPSPSDKLPR